MIKKIFGAFAAFVAVSLFAAPAIAQTLAEKSSAYGNNIGFMAFAVAFGIGAAALGGALGQGKASAAALEGISRNPNASDKVFVPMILGLAFIESLVLFTWVLMLLLLNKF
ncbi:MAG: ATP synthase F0 subunit C [Clostridia bacterium]|nr:ATP synthase F0 subunit C [Deltaproteobacteria bacterium]